MTGVMSYNLVSELNNEKDAWKIKVRVIRMWDAINLKTNQQISLDLLLLDEQNNDVHATIWNTMVDKFKNDIEEGKIYYISNLRVGSCNKKYRPIPTVNKLFFRFNTDVKEAKESPTNIPAQKFHFVDSNLLAERVNDTTQLSDIIGQLTGIGPIEEVYFDRGPVQRRTVELLTLKALPIRVTLWSKAATEIDDTAFSDSKEPVVMVVTATIVKQFNGAYSLSSTTASKVYMNLEIPEAIEFLESSENYGSQIEQLQSQQTNQLPIHQQIQHNRKTIDELKGIQWESDKQDKIVTCEATVAEILAQPGWYYNSCQLCPKKLKPKDDTLWCDKCNIVPQYPLQRYRLELRVTDSTGYTTFVLFDKDCEKLIGKTARELANELIFEEENNKGTIPSVLKNIIGHTYTFQLRLNDYNLKEGWQSFTINKVFDANSALLSDHNIDNENAMKLQPTSSTGPSNSPAHQKKRLLTQSEDETIENMTVEKEIHNASTTKKRAITKKIK